MVLQVFPPRRRLPRLSVGMAIFVAGVLAFVAVMGALGYVSGHLQDAQW